MRWRTVARALGVAVLLATDVGGAEPVSAPIVGGGLTADHPAVGALLLGTTPASATTACTVTLVGCRTVVTAAKCVCPTTGKTCQDLGVPPGLAVYFAHAGFFAIESVRVHDKYDGAARADVAVLRLATTVTGIEPLLVNDVELAPFESEGTIVGFGWETAATGDSGLKREASVWTAPCEGEADDATSMCWTYDGTDGDMCGPDAGGPVLIDLGYGPMVGAVSSGGDSPCVVTDHAHATDLYAHLDWVEDAAAGDLYTSACDDMPAVGADEVSVSDFTGDLTSAQPVVEESVAVGLNATELRVALTGSEQPGTDFDLHVRAADAAPGTFACSGTGPGQYAFCRIAAPQSGTWIVRAERVNGEGTFQLIATTVGGDYPECGNGIREPGEDCDGGDLGACTAGCDADCYCLACTDDLDVREVDLWPKLFLGTVLGDTFGTYVDFDPVIDGLTIELLDATQTATIEISPDDPGWALAKPERGKFRWRGEPGLPLRRLEVRTNPKRRTRWRLIVKGRDVPGTQTLDLHTLTVRVKAGSRCSQRRFGGWRTDR